MADAQSVCAYVGNGCLIGLYADDNRDWHWIDGSNDLGFGFDDNGDPIKGGGFWYTDRPNDLGGNQDCVYLWEPMQYYLDDRPCGDWTPGYPLCNDG